MTALMLGATGVFVYLRFAAELDNAINSGLRSRGSDLVAVVHDSEPGLGEESHLIGRSESFAEILNAKGRVEESTEAVGNAVLLSPAEVRRALRGPLLLDRGPLPGLHDESRLLAVPVNVEGQRWIVVVGTSTEERSESLRDLAQLLLLGGPVALILASLAAYWVAAAALRPVEAMRTRAATISAAEPDERLPVPPTHDEVARLGATLNEMLERLGEALEHERAFVADASHELRTPLAILRTELDLALAEGRSPAELRAALASAAEETDRLTQLAEDLLTIAQTERGELPLRLTRVDPREVLEGARRRFTRRAEEEGRTISLRGKASEIRADRLRIDQAIGSVLDNALRYGAGEVLVSLVSVGDTVEIRVRDHGEGFPPEFLPRAFERFSRPSASRSDGGSGLGLAIVRTVARAHGGEAYAENAADGGAEVWLLLPRSERGA